MEVLSAVVIVGLGVTLALPAVTAMSSQLKTDAAAAELARTFQALRWQSVVTGRAHGLLFGRDRLGWYWHRVADRNGNGLRMSELREGVDATLSGPHRLEPDFAGAGFGFPGRGPFRRIPPASGWLDDLDDPIHIGHTDLVAFSPLGTSTSGSFYVSDGQRSLSAVVLYGRTVRVRLWSWNPRTERWMP